MAMSSFSTVEFKATVLQERPTGQRLRNNVIHGPSQAPADYCPGPLAITAWLAISMVSMLTATAPTFANDPSNRTTPNVLMITVDTLRPDALGWVAGRGETPTIDRLAETGLAMPKAVSPVPITLPAHASILTGLIPRRHGVRDNGQLLAATVPTLGEALATGGYSTAAFVSGFPLQRIFGLDRGFNHYDDTLPEGREGWLERRAGDTTAAALDWLRSAPEPWFAWVHYYDPHDPYDPPRTFWQPGPRGPYDGEVAYTDHAIGTLLDGLTLPDARPRLTILTADHGEALGEHRETTHGYFIYDSTVTVPMILHWPGTIEPRRSDHPARLVDLAPTVLDLLDLPALGNTDGHSLRPLIAQSEVKPAPAYIETRLPWVYFGWAPLKAVRDQGWKLVVAPKPELFDLDADPAESRNLINEARREARRLQALLKEIEARPMVGMSAALADPESLAKLRALGYVGSGGGADEPPANLPDPKDRVEMRQTLLDAEALMKGGQFNAAVARFDAVLADEPNNRFATLRAGTALLKAGQHTAAVPRLKRAVELDPARAEARYVLGEALLHLGRFAEATPQWMELVRLQPRRFEAWANLAAALHGDGQSAQAADAVKRALALAPDEEPLRQALARYLAAANDPKTGPTNDD